MRDLYSIAGLELDEPEDDQQPLSGFNTSMLDSKPAAKGQSPSSGPKQDKPDEPDEPDEADEPTASPEFEAAYARVERRMRELGYSITRISKFRDPEKQNQLYQIGRTVRGRNASPQKPMGDTVTNADGYDKKSRHQTADAFDVVFKSGTPNWREFGRIAKEEGLEWGGDFSNLYDPGHIQWPKSKSQTRAAQGATSTAPAAADQGLSFTKPNLSLTDIAKGVKPAPAAAAPETVKPTTKTPVLTMLDLPDGWNTAEERKFAPWYAAIAKQYGLSENPDDPEHHYNYRFAFKQGAMPDADGHWPSAFKDATHPNRYVDGIDTITGLPQAKAEAQATAATKPSSTQGFNTSMFEDAPSQGETRDIRLAPPATIHRDASGKPLDYNVSMLEGTTTRKPDSPTAPPSRARAAQDWLTSTPSEAEKSTAAVKQHAARVAQAVETFKPLNTELERHVAIADRARDIFERTQKAFEQRAKQWEAGPKTDPVEFAALQQEAAHLKGVADEANAAAATVRGFADRLTGLYVQHQVDVRQLQKEIADNSTLLANTNLNRPNVFDLARAMRVRNPLDFVPMAYLVAEQIPVVREVTEGVASGTAHMLTSAIGVGNAVGVIPDEWMKGASEASKMLSPEVSQRKIKDDPWGTIGNWRWWATTAVGEQLPFLVGLGAAGKIAQTAKGAAQIAAIGESVIEGGGTYVEAIEAGASKNNARMAAAFVAAMNYPGLLVTDISLFSRDAKTYLGNILKKGAVEMTQENYQTLLSNLTAMFSYDPNRQWNEGLLESTVLASSMGAGFGALQGPPIDPNVKAALIDEYVQFVRNNPNEDFDPRSPAGQQLADIMRRGAKAGVTDPDVQAALKAVDEGTYQPPPAPGTGTAEPPPAPGPPPPPPSGPPPGGAPGGAGATVVPTPPPPPPVVEEHPDKAALIAEYVAFLRSADNQRVEAGSEQERHLKDLTQRAQAAGVTPEDVRAALALPAPTPSPVAPVLPPPAGGAATLPTDRGGLYDEEVRLNAPGARSDNMWVSARSTPETITHAEEVIKNELKDGDILEDATGDQWLVRRSVGSRGQESIRLVPPDQPNSPGLSAWTDQDGTWRRLDDIRPLVERSKRIPADPDKALADDILRKIQEEEAAAAGTPPVVAPTAAAPVVTEGLTDEQIMAAKGADLTDRQLARRQELKLIAKTAAADTTTTTAAAPTTPTPVVTTPTPVSAAPAGESDDERNRRVAASAVSATPEAVVPGGAYWMDPNTIDVDMERLQFKSDADKQGVTAADRIKGPWSTSSGGVLTVWKDPANGRVYVVNGHHRLEAARRLGAKEVLVLALTVKTVEEARLSGAFTNITEGRGKAIDVAKVIRGGKYTDAELEAAGIDLSKKLAKDGRAISRLSEPVYVKVLLGELEESIGVAIGEAGLSEDGQMNAVKLVAELQDDRQRVDKEQLAEMLANLSATPDVVVSDGEQTDIWGVLGDSPRTRNIGWERAGLVKWIKKQLASDSALFKRVSKSQAAKKLASVGGNVIDVESSEAKAQAEALIGEIFGKLANKRGPIGKLLDEAATRIVEGEKPSNVRPNLLAAVKDLAPAAFEAELRGESAVVPVAPPAGVPPGGGTTAAPPENRGPETDEDVEPPPFRQEGPGLFGDEEPTTPPAAPAPTDADTLAEIHKERADAIAALKAKLGSSQANIGVDPEIVTLVVRILRTYIKEGILNFRKAIAAFHVEWGSRAEELDEYIEGIWQDLTDEKVSVKDAVAANAAARDDVDPNEGQPRDIDPPGVDAVVFRSGNSRAPNDLQGHINAGQPVGIAALSKNKKDPSKPFPPSGRVLTMLAAYAKAGGKVFVDSGAFGIPDVDFKRVFGIYMDILARVGKEHAGNVYLTMPDKVGDAEKTLALQETHAARIRSFIEAGANVIVPVQVFDGAAKREMSQVSRDAMRVARAFPSARIGLPGNAAAITPKELEWVTGVLKAEGVYVAGFHFLGVGETGRGYDAFVKAVRDNYPQADITADSNRTRAMMGEGRGPYEDVARITEDRATDRVDATPDADTTELAGYFYRGELQAFSKGELETIATALDVTVEKLRAVAADVETVDEDGDSALQDLINAIGGDQYFDLVIHRIAKTRAEKAVRPGVRTEVIARADATTPWEPTGEANEESTYAGQDLKDVLDGAIADLRGYRAAATLIEEELENNTQLKPERQRELKKELQGLLDQIEGMLSEVRDAGGEEAYEYARRRMLEEGPADVIDHEIDDDTETMDDDGPPPTAAESLEEAVRAQTGDERRASEVVQLAALRAELAAFEADKASGKKITKKRQGEIDRLNDRIEELEERPAEDAAWKKNIQRIEDAKDMTVEQLVALTSRQRNQLLHAWYAERNYNNWYGHEAASPYNDIRDRVHQAERLVDERDRAEIPVVEFSADELKDKWNHESQKWDRGSVAKQLNAASDELDDKADIHVVKKAFELNGKLWAYTGSAGSYDGPRTWGLREVVPVKDWTGPVLTYADKREEWARNEDNDERTGGGDRFGWSESEPDGPVSERGDMTGVEVKVGSNKYVYTGGRLHIRQRGEVVEARAPEQTPEEREADRAETRRVILEHKAEAETKTATPVSAAPAATPAPLDWASLFATPAAAEPPAPAATPAAAPPPTQGQGLLLVPGIGDEPIGFGKHAKMLVKDLAREQPGYANWLFENGTFPRAKQVAAYLATDPVFTANRTARPVATFDAAAALAAVTPEALAVLKPFKITAVPHADGSVTLAGSTYDHKETIRQIGGGDFQRDGSKTWRLPPAGFTAFVNDLQRRLDAGERPGVPKAAYKSDPELARLRKAAEGGPDRRNLESPVESYVREDTRKLIELGLTIGMPPVVVEEQIEDVARIVRGYNDKLPLFLLASEPGSGKTFVLGGAIREILRANPNAKITYVTLRQELISQIKKDLAAYGIENVRFITYPKLRTTPAEASDVIIFDEAHSAKNVQAEGSAQAKAAAEWIEASGYPILATATPFENPVQAQYLESTGVFDSFGDFGQWAKAFGATGVKLDSGASVLSWRRTQTSDDDAKAARDWFNRLGVFTSRRIRLPHEQVDSRLVKIDVSKDQADRYDAFSQAAADEADKLGGFARAWIINFQKRLLEAAKVQQGIKEAKAARARGRFPIIFVETKAERKLDIPDLMEREAEWQMAVAMALSMREKPPARSEYGLPPQGIVDVLARYMSITSQETIEIPSAEDEVIKAFGAEEVAIFTGSVTPKKAQDNLDAWRQGTKPVMVATMAKGGTGLSLHDKVGDHQTTQININLPWTATQVVQVAQRSARYGLKGRAEMQWIFADNIPFDRTLALRVGGRMADMGAVVHGERLSRSDEIAEWDFEDDLFSDAAPAELADETPKPPPVRAGAVTSSAPSAELLAMRDEQARPRPDQPVPERLKPTPEPAPAAAAEPTKHLYRPIYRPPGFATMPKGWELVERGTGGHFPKRTDLPEGTNTFGVVSFDRELTPQEVAQWELEPLTPPTAEPAAPATETDKDAWTPEGKLARTDSSREGEPLNKLFPPVIKDLRESYEAAREAANALVGKRLLPKQRQALERSARVTGEDYADTMTFIEHIAGDEGVAYVRAQVETEGPLAPWVYEYLRDEIRKSGTPPVYSTEPLTDEELKRLEDLLDKDNDPQHQDWTRAELEELESLRARFHAEDSESNDGPPSYMAAAELLEKPVKDILPPPTKKKVLMSHVVGDETLSTEEAAARVQSWKDEAKRIGRDEDRSNLVVISLFDRTGIVSQPYVDAGYDVRRYDIANGQDLLTNFPIRDIIDIVESGKQIVGVLAQPPCTSFAQLGSQWWKTHHDRKDQKMVEKAYGYMASEFFDTPLDYAITLVAATEQVIALSNPSQFHVLENPVGRIAKQTGLPGALLTFDPHHFGDPYTKKTILWGSFNTDLPTANVTPTQGSLIHKLSSQDPRRKWTAEGFAYAFFMANHEKPVDRMKPYEGYTVGDLVNVHPSALEDGGATVGTLERILGDGRARVVFNDGTMAIVLAEDLAGIATAQDDESRAASLAKVREILQRDKTARRKASGDASAIDLHDEDEGDEGVEDDDVEDDDEDVEEPDAARVEQIERIVAMARKPADEVREQFEYLGSNGKYYGIFGVPLGVTLGDEKRSLGWVYVASNGTTYGNKRYDTADEARAAQNERLDKNDDDFREALLKMNSERLDSQEKFWTEEIAKRDRLNAPFKAPRTLKQIAEPHTPPADRDEYLSQKSYQASVREGAGPTNIDRPNSAIIPAVGTWMIDDTFKGADGHGISQLVDIAIDNIEISEDSAGRFNYVEQYARWLNEGFEAPPITVLQTDKGTLKTIDHRRLLAAKAAGRTSIKAWVSWSTENPRHKKLTTELTYELAQKGARPLPVAPAMPAHTITKDDQKRLDELKRRLKPRELDQQEQSYRDWEENAGRVSGNPEAASTKDLLRAVHYLDHRLRRAWAKKNEGLADAIEREKTYLQGLADARPDRWTRFRQDEESPLRQAADVLSTGEIQPRLPGDVGDVREREIASPRLAAEEALTTGYTKAAMKMVFQLTDAMADAVDALVQAIGLDTSRIRLGQGSSDRAGLKQEEKDRRLSILHNLSTDNLIYADELGGLVMPSMGVVRPDMAMESYGGITLIGRSGLANPRETPIFDADIYSARFPRPSYPKAKSAVAQRLMDRFKAFTRLFDDKHIEYTFWDNAVNTPNPGDTISRMMQSEAAKAWFLKEKLGVEVKPRMKAKDPRYGWNWMPAWIDFVKTADFSAENEAWDSPERKALYVAAGKAALEAIDQYVSQKSYMKGEDEDLRARLAKTFGGNVVDPEDGRIALSVFHNARADVAEKGTKRVDGEKTRKALDKALAGHEAEFKAWVDDTVLGMHGDPYLLIGRRKAPVTAENALDAMQRQPLQATEKTLTFGEGKARAKSAKRMSSTDEMRNRAEWQLSDKGEVDAARATAKKALEEWRNAAVDYYGDRYTQSFGRVWEGLDASMRALARWTKNGTKEGMRRALYAEGFRGVPDEVLEQGVMAGRMFADAPVPYFEAKPERVVRLSEFAGAVVPANADEKVLAVLDKHNIPYATYPTEYNEPERKAVTIKFRDELAAGGADVLFQREPVNAPAMRNWYYSNTSKALDSWQKKGTPAQLLAHLKKVPGAMEEATAIGLTDWLEHHVIPSGVFDVDFGPRVSVTRDEAQRFVESRQIQVTTIKRGEPVDVSAVIRTPEMLVHVDALREMGYAVQLNGAEMPGLEWVGEGPEPQMALPAAVQGHWEPIWKAIQTEGRGKYFPLRYESYVLPGGENQREVLLTLPASRPVGPKVYDGAGGLVQPGIAAGWQMVEGGPADGLDFISSHWDTPNVVVHLRLNDRIINGKRVLFAEEIQSDWGQRGRKRGYESDRLARNAKVDDIREQLRAIEDMSERPAGTDRKETGLRNELATLLAKDFSQAVPDMPFKGNAWKKLALKRLLALAAEGGYDGVAWTTGEQQIERYKLSQKVSSIDWQVNQSEIKDVPGEYRRVQINLIGGDTIKLHLNDQGTVTWASHGDTRFLHKTLDEIIGKDLAEKVSEGPGGFIEGVDLDIGSKGMIGFYDKELPNLANDIVKKYGTKVGPAKVPTKHTLQARVRPGGEWIIYDPVTDAQFVGPETGWAEQTFDTKQEAEAAMREYAPGKMTGETVHVLELPQRLREDIVEKGLPLFQGEKASVTFYDDGNAIIRALKSADVSSAIHELAHVLRRQLMDRNIDVSDRAGVTDEDIVTAAQWAGARLVNGQFEWTEAAEEKFARGFERYLYDGKAPTAALQPLFDKFSGWLMAIYRQLIGSSIAVDISPEMRRVFDRLLTRQARISAQAYDTPTKTTQDAWMKPPPKARKPKAMSFDFDKDQGSLFQKDDLTILRNEVDALYEGDGNQQEIEDREAALLEAEDALEARGAALLEKGEDIEDEVGSASADEQLAAAYFDQFVRPLTHKNTPQRFGDTASALSNMRHALGLDWRRDAKAMTDDELIAAAKDAYEGYIGRLARLKRGAKQNEAMREFLRKAGAPPSLLFQLSEAAGDEVIESEVVGADGRPDAPTKRVYAAGRITKGLDQLRKGEINDDAFVDDMERLRNDLLAKADARVEATYRRERERGYDIVVEKLVAARRRGQLSDETVEFALWVLQKNPDLANRLAISIRKPTQAGVAGFYNRLAEIITVIKGTASPSTVVHELLHHTERMMPTEVQEGIRREWWRAVVAAMKAAEGNQKQLDAYTVLIEGALGFAPAHEAATEFFINGVLPRDQYHLLNPSEFWAENASQLMAQRFNARNSWIRRALQWLDELVDRLAHMLGLSSDAPVLRGLDVIMAASGELINPNMIGNIAGPLSFSVAEDKAKKTVTLVRSYVAQGLSLQEAINQFHKDFPVESYKQQRIFEMAWEALTGQKPPKWAGNINLDKFPVPNNEKREFALMVAQNDEYMKQRRGVVTWEETRALAVALPMIKMVPKPGSAFNASELEALAGHVIATRQQLGDVTAQMAAGDNQSKTVARHAQLMAQLQVLLETLSGATAEAGRALNILAKVRALIATNDDDFLQAAIDQLGGREDIEKIAKRLAEFGDDRIAKYRFIKSLAKVGVADWISWYWYTNLLSGPLTQARNLLGNSSQLAFSMASQPLAAGVDSVRALVTGTPRTVMLSEMPSAMLGLWHGAYQGAKNAAFMMRNGFTMEDVVSLEFRPPEVPGGAWTNVIGRGLEAADVFFRSMRAMSELYSMAYVAANQSGHKPGSAEYDAVFQTFVAIPPLEAMKAIQREAKRSTFREDPGSFMKAIMDWRKDFKITLPSGRVVKLWNPIRMFVPFVQTPANIMKMSAEATPLGFLMAPLRQSPRERSQSAGRAALATALLTPLVMLAMRGLVSGSGPDDKELKDELYRQGWQPNSIRIGDAWYNYSNLQPLALPLSLIANWYESYLYNGETFDFGTIVAKTAKSVLQQSYLSGLQAVQEAIENSDRYGSAYIEKMIQSWSPLSSFRSQVTRAIDPVIRQPDTIAETLQANTPGLSEGVRSRRDAFGEEATRGSNVLSRLFNPITISEVKDSPLERELYALRNDYQVGFPSRTVTVAGQTVKLTADEYDAFLRDSGQTIKKQLTTLIAHPTWARRTPANKASLVEQAVSAARAGVRAQLLLKVRDRVSAGGSR